MSEQPIAVFDSGVGGLTVLHECLVSLPSEDFLYLGDDANFPYGTKTADELRGLVRRNVAFLLDRGRSCSSSRATRRRRPAPRRRARSPRPTGSRS